jgi:hypothetical protein
MASGEIRLVILDMGGVLWEEVPDERAVPRPDTDGLGDIFYQIDDDYMFRYPGVCNRIFTGVRELFANLAERDVHVSINSLNTPHAWRWIESDFYNLNPDGRVRHSRICVHPDPAKRGKPERTDIKGIWTSQIISGWNADYPSADPIINSEVLFVDDDEWNHKAVQQVCPGVHCIFPPLSGPEGMLDVVREMDRISGKNQL